MKSRSCSCPAPCALRLSQPRPAASAPRASRPARAPSSSAPRLRARALAVGYTVQLSAVDLQSAHRRPAMRRGYLLTSNHIPPLHHLARHQPPVTQKLPRCCIPPQISNNLMDSKVRVSLQNHAPQTRQETPCCIVETCRFRCRKQNLRQKLI